MKLRYKLIITFGSIVIIMSLFQSIFFQQRVEDDFQNYIEQNEIEKIAVWKELLKEYYLYYGSFDGIQEYIIASQVDLHPKRGYSGGNNLRYLMVDNFEIAIADENGHIIGDTQGEWLGDTAQKISGLHEDIIVEGEKIGELIAYRERNVSFPTIEQQFIDSMKASIIYGAIISILLVVIIGLFLSRKITKPLEKLMVGIEKISQGDTSYKVEINTKDEFSQLADAFNNMSYQIKKNEEVRRNLVADVAHELRTPLSILGGRLESIQEGALEPSQDIIIQLNDEVYRLKRLVNDLQQLSLAEAGKLPLNKSSVTLNDLIQKVIYHFSWLAEEKNIKILFDNTAKHNINIDSDRITQVIINILGNALRHTPENGTVQVKIFNKDNKYIIVEIRDNGPGIDKEQLPYIFDRFYRTDFSRSRDKGGIGLGLAIAKGYVEAHNGHIHVESEQSIGTSFIIKLPIK